MSHLSFVLLITVWLHDSTVETYSVPVANQMECAEVYQSFLLVTGFDPHYQGASAKPECLLISSGNLEAKHLPFEGDQGHG